MRNKPMKIFAAISVPIFLALSLFGGAVLAQPRAQTKTTNCVLTWKETAIPNVGRLTSVKAIAANDVWVSGEGDLLHWDGEGWQAIASPIDGTINALAATASNDVWAVGDDRSVSHWDGTEWKIAHTFDKGSYYAIIILAPDNIWVGGAYFWNWDGAIWKEIPMPTNVLNPHIRSLSAVTANDIWAVGNSGGSHEQAITFHWDGSKWTQILGLQGGGSRSFLNGVAALSASDVWAVGYDTLGGDFIGHWDGATWTRFDAPTFGSGGMIAFAPDNIYAVGDGIIHWDGKEWLLDENTPASSYLTSVSALSENEIWAVGSFYSPGNPDRSLLMQATLPCVEPTPTPEPTVPPVTPQPTDEACALSAPQLSSPKNKVTLQTSTVKLEWASQNCATRYEVLLKRDSKKGATMAREMIDKPSYTTPALAAQHQYLWRVRACDATQCGVWSKWRRFTIE